MLKKSDASAVHFDSFWSAFGYIFDVSHSNEGIRHNRLLKP